MFNIGVKVAKSNFSTFINFLYITIIKGQLMVGTIVVGTRCFGVLNLFCWDKTSYNFVVDCYN